MLRCDPRAALLLAVPLTGCSATQTAPVLPEYGAVGTPQKFEGMGPHTRTITTRSPEAQEYFNQGLNWMYGFNHDEAVHSFTKAAELDPGCAMAWWGVSHAQGPNYNDPLMSEARNAAAWEALQNALAQLDEETPAERALIEALTYRYADPAPEDRKPLEKAFSDAMARVWAQHPNDSDVGTLYAESLMVQYPWELYTSDQQPAREDTLTIVAVLEQVFAMDRRHPGANHLYIHAVEPSDDKERGIAAADRLSDLVPGSGHLQHMPSHIYVQVGMWERSIEQNTKAMDTDADAVRRRLGLHGADLHRRGVGPEQHALAVGLGAEVEGVVHLPRRVLGRDVESGEVAEVVLDVGALGDAEPHVGEDRGDLVDDLAHRVDAADGLGPGRQGDVDPLLRQAGLEPGALELGLAHADRRAELVLELVERRAGTLSLLRAHRPEPLHELGDTPLAAERGDASPLEGIAVPGLGHAAEKFRR